MLSCTTSGLVPLPPTDWVPSLSAALNTGEMPPRVLPQLLVTTTRYLGWVCAVSWVKSSSAPSSSVGTDGSGRIQPKSLASPAYWIWIWAVITPPSAANTIRSPAWTTGTDGSGGVKQPHAWARGRAIVSTPATVPAIPRRRIHVRIGLLL